MKSYLLCKPIGERALDTFFKEYSTIEDFSIFTYKIFRLNLVIECLWWRERDLNSRPPGYESGALTS